MNPSDIIPALRTGLDIFPSPVPDRPGFLLRDSLGYSQCIMLIPNGWAQALLCFDGRHTILDCQAFLTRLTGEIGSAEDIAGLVRALAENGFLLTPEFEALRQGREEEFRRAERRDPHHAGAAYPADAEELRRRLEEYRGGARRSELAGYHPPRTMEFSMPAAPARSGGASRPVGIAAPHASPEAAFDSYIEAYRRLPDLSGRTVVILGTSHYGTPNRFGLTSKTFVTPLGALATDAAIVDRLLATAPGSIVEEDYCHSIEHSIEFQCVFSQFMQGAADARRTSEILIAADGAEPSRSCPGFSFKIVPILCGPIFDLEHARVPERDPDEVRRFTDALGAIAAREGDRLFWILGIDMAHVGRRYGDEKPIAVGDEFMHAVEVEEHRRAEYLAAGDVEGFRAAVVEGGNDRLRWCGFTPIYTFLRALPGARCRPLMYQQWNIDPESVVTFGAMGLEQAGS
jgi:predicted class III extradiol MEMO1 family dioxygenase